MRRSLKDFFRTLPVRQSLTAWKAAKPRPNLVERQEVQSPSFSLSFANAEQPKGWTLNFLCSSGRSAKGSTLNCFCFRSQRYLTAALTACNSCNERTCIAPPAAREPIASTIAWAPVIVVTQGTLYCSAARRMACSSKCDTRPEWRINNQRNIASLDMVDDVRPSFVHFENVRTFKPTSRRRSAVPSVAIISKPKAGRACAQE